MKKHIILLAATVALAGCGGSIKEQAMSQCMDEADRLTSAGIDADEFCGCVTEDIGDGASMDEANEAIIGRTQQCTSEALQGMTAG